MTRGTLAFRILVRLQGWIDKIYWLLIGFLSIGVIVGIWDPVSGTRAARHPRERTPAPMPLRASPLALGRRAVGLRRGYHRRMGNPNWADIKTAKQREAQANARKARQRQAAPSTRAAEAGPRPTPPPSDQKNGKAA